MLEMMYYKRPENPSPDVFSQGHAHLNAEVRKLWTWPNLEGGLFHKSMSQDYVGFFCLFVYTF